VTARIALAQAYGGYAEKARGQGYANTVSAEGWRLHAERYALDAATLAEAASFRKSVRTGMRRCSGSLSKQGWEKAQARELFEQAVAFEPDYYHYYREYAYYLLPKWEGQPGDVEAFAKETYEKVGGQYGAYLYFEIASLVTCQCDSDDSDMENLSWPRVAARGAFAKIGEDWDHTVWHGGSANFDRAKAWAGSQ
jgi:hypothetical protein